MKSAGFTIIEIAIVLSITVILSSILLGYNRSSEKQIALRTDQAKVVSFLNRAKSFTLERRLVPGGENACAFGVSFGGQQMSIFKDPCPANFEYDGGEEVSGETLSLDPRIEFASSPREIVFEAPYLKTYYGTILITNPVTITIKIKGSTDPNSQAIITVGSGGEISTQ